MSDTRGYSEKLEQLRMMRRKQKNAAKKPNSLYENLREERTWPQTSSNHYDHAHTEIVVDDLSVDEWGVSIVGLPKEIQREIDRAEKAAKLALFYGCSQNTADKIRNSWKTPSGSS